MTLALTSLASLRAWAGVSGTGDDALLTQLIAQAGQFVAHYLQRASLFASVYAETRDGEGSERLILREWPVWKVTSLTIDHTIIPASSGPGNFGYVLENWNGLPPGRPQVIYLRNGCFRRGVQNVIVNYLAGYAILNEAQTVPTGASALAVSQPYGAFAGDLGVTYASGAAMVSVAASPMQGQYTVDAFGNYGFSAADAGMALLINYLYTPADLAQACLEIAGERYRARNRIGEVSKSLNGAEVMQFSQKDISDYVRALLQPYRRVLMG